MLSFQVFGAIAQLERVFIFEQKLESTQRGRKGNCPASFIAK